MKALSLKDYTYCISSWTVITTLVLKLIFEYTVFRSCRDISRSRKVLQRAVQSASDNPEMVVQALLSFEREEGEWDLGVYFLLWFIFCRFKNAYLIALPFAGTSRQLTPFISGHQ